MRYTDTSTNTARRDQIQPFIATIAGLNAISALSHLAQFGIIYPMLSLWLSLKGMQTFNIGLVGSAVWVGMLAATLWTPALLLRFSPGRIAATSGLLTAAAAGLMPLLPATSVVAWLAAAASLGACAGIRWISVESWLYAVVPPASRGRVVGIHETFIYVAQAAGPALVAWVGLNNGMGFWLAAAVSCLTIIPLTFAKPPRPDTAATGAQVRPLHLLLSMPHRARHSLGIQIALVAGLLDGMLFGLLGLFSLNSGLSLTQASLTLTLFGVGGLVSQIQLGWWSDRKGVRHATRAIALCGVCGAALLVYPSIPVVLPAAFLLGIVAACGLTLSIIAITQEADNEGRHLSVAIAEVSVAFTVGSALGPAVAGAALQYVGNQSYHLLSLACCLVLYGLARRQALA
jgi:MFS family permease